MRDAPGILSVEAESLNVLREASIASGSKRAGDAGVGAGSRVALRGWRNIVKRQSTRDATAVASGRIDVAIRIGRILDELFRSGCKRTAEDGLVNKVNAE